MSRFGEVPSQDALERSIIQSAINFRKGATAPTDATVAGSSTPTVPALLFDAVGELVNVHVMLPFEMDRTVNPRLVLTVALVNGQSNGQTLDFTCNYVAVRENDTGNGPAKTSSQVLGQTTVTTGNGLAVGDVYTLEFTFDVADANNPINAGTTAVLLELGLTNVTGVAAIHVLAACFAFEATR
jgi:hypothetical protein